MKTLYVYGLPANLRSTLLRSPQWRSARDMLERAGAHAQWSRVRLGWTVRTERLGDVMAAAESEGFRVVMRGALEEASS